MKILLSFLLTFIFVFSFGCGSNAPEKPKLKIGDDVIFQSDGKLITVAGDRESYDKFIKAEMAKDEDVFDALFRAGKIFSVDNNTKARITDDDGLAFQIKFLDGELKGQSAWTTKGSLKPSQTK